MLPDRKKVIKALTCCSDLSGKSCAECTYVIDDFCIGNGMPIGKLAHDALELLKEQEPVKPELYLVGEPRWKFYRCPVCKMAWYYKGNYCLNCGREVDWNG